MDSQSSTGPTTPSENTLTPTKSIKKPNTCALDGCNERAVKIIGDCRYCTFKFCSKHRLPEAHICPNLDSCRTQSQNKLASKLLSEKVVTSKV